MDKWKEVFVKGFAPVIKTEGLLALKQALVVDDPKLIQGATTSPPPMTCVQDWPCEAACGIGYCGWQGDGLHIVCDVEEYFAKVCFQADQFLGEPAGCRHFLNWFDDSPRSVVREKLIPVIDEILVERNYGKD